MSYIGTYFSRFLNTIINPNVKHNDILSVINNVYPRIKDGEIDFIDITFDFEDVLQNIDVTNYSLFQRLSEKKTVNGKTVKVGYNPITIKTLLSDVTLERLLHELSGELDQLYVSLDQIHRNTYNSLLIFKFFQLINLDIEPNYQVDLAQYQQQQESFGYIFNREPYLPTDYTHKQTTVSDIWIVNHNLDIESTVSITVKCYDNDNTDISSKVDNVQRNDSNTLTITFKDTFVGKADIQRNIYTFPFFYSLITLYRLYSASSKYYNNMLYEMHTDNLLQANVIKLGFEDYIGLNITEISTELAEYIYTSFFRFSGDISTYVNSDTISAISNTLEMLPALFSQAEEDGIISLETATYMVYDATNLTAYWSAFKVTNEIFYDQISDFFDFTYGFEWYSQMEDVVKSHIAKHLSTNTELLRMLENISFQFKNDPLYFINSHQVIHGKYARDLISNISSGFEVTKLMNSVTPKDDIINLLRDFCQNNYLQQHDDMIRFNAFIHFRNILNTFIDSDLFTNWVIKEFIPMVEKTINIHYYIQVEDYTVVDKVKNFMKVLFMKHILESVLFNDFIEAFLLKFNGYLATSTFELTDAEIDYFSKLFLDEIGLSNVFNSFFKGAVLSRYVEGSLQSHSL